MAPNSYDDALGMRVAILGAGISGLSAAYYLRGYCPQAQIELFEARPRVGGVLETVRKDDYLIERAADNFLRGPTSPWAEQLCQQMGFDGQLIPTATENRGAHIAWNGQLIRVPEGFQLMAPARFAPILRSPLLTWRGKLRLCLEPLIPKRIVDESLTDFATRRLGREAFERLVQPLVSGIYTADPDQLSVQAALPQMVEMVSQHGSLYGGMRHRRKQAAKRTAASESGSTTDTSARGARYGLFVAPREGMQQWIDELERDLLRPKETAGSVSIIRGVPIERIELIDSHPTEARAWRNRWRLVTQDNPKLAEKLFDAIIIAVPTYKAAKVLSSVDTKLSSLLNEISYASSVVVAMGFRRDQIARKLDAFGSVVPRIERRSVLALSYSSLKFPGRAAPDHVLIRAFVGGALQPHLVDLEDRELSALVRKDLDDLLGVTGDAEICDVIRWARAMPQYHLGHAERLEQIAGRLSAFPGLQLAGNGYRGVGIPQCVASGERAAKRIAEPCSDEPSGA